jgi:integrase
VEVNVSGRRGAGEGSVYEIKSRGLWAASVDLGMVDGKRVRKVVKAKKKEDVLAKMRELQHQNGLGLPIPDGNLTTEQWLNYWLEEVLPGEVKESTATNYGNVLNFYVIPHIGRVPLAKLGPEHVQRMMRTLDHAGKKPRTVSLARTVLRRSLGDAERWSKVNRNAAALVRAPRKAESKLDDALDAEEAGKVLKAASADRLEALAVLVLMVGLRQGEAIQLRWSDVDLKAGELMVTEAKTAAGLRTVALPSRAVAALKAHERRQKAERLAASHWDDPELVFATSIGTELDRRNLLRWWHDLTISAGVGRRRFHASRHSAATLMLNNGVPLEVVSATLGHAGLAITADVYAKVHSDLQRTAADAMQKVLG